MKFIYIDESGSFGHTDVFTICGIMVDAYRRRKMVAALDQELKLSLEFWRQNYHKLPVELKTDSFINGRREWGSIPAEERKNFLSKLCQITVERGGTIFGVSFSFESFNKAINSNLEQPIKDPWLSGAMLIICLVQKNMQKLPRNKGQTVVNIDNNPGGLHSLTIQLRTRNSWFDGLYRGTVKRSGKAILVPQKSSDRFDQIIDEPSPIESKYSSFIQVVDAISYIYRRHLELMSLEENWPGEKDYYNNLVITLDKKRTKFGQRSHREPCVTFFEQVKHPDWKL